MVEKFTEKDLDTALAEGFRNSEMFAQWFVSKTRFSAAESTCVWCRSGYPWGRFTFEIENSDTGQLEEITRDSETDVLVVYENTKGYRFGIHIENKLANGKYTLYQPEFYSLRAKAWIGHEKYGNYVDFETVLVAPLEFYAINFEESQKFDKFVSYEEIGLLLPEFSDYLRSRFDNKS